MGAQQGRGLSSRVRGWADRLAAEFATRHRRPFNIICHLIGMPVIAGGVFLTLLWMHPVAGLLCIGVGFAVTFTGHLTEGSLPVLATPAWYASLGAPVWWGRHLLSLARTRRLWSPAALSH